jgi:hypothetical protein
MAPPHKPFYRVNRVMRICDRLTFRHLAYEYLAVFRERDYGRRYSRTFFIYNDFRLSAFHDGNARVRRAKVYSNYLRHNSSGFY